jgi:hypothetical protein
VARKKKPVDLVVEMANGSLKGCDPPPVEEHAEENGTPPTPLLQMSLYEENLFRDKLRLFDREIETLRVNAVGAQKIAREAVAFHKHAVKERKEFILKHFEAMPLFDPPAGEEKAEAGTEAVV